MISVWQRVSRGPRVRPPVATAEVRHHPCRRVCVRCWGRAVCAGHPDPSAPAAAPPKVAEGCCAMTSRIGAGCGVRPVWMTSTMDGAEHAIMADAMTAGLAARNRLFAALCGTQVVAASMTAPPGRRCARCVAFQQTRASVRDLARPVLARRRWRYHLLWGRRHG
jgi:hypothetical protein